MLGGRTRLGGRDLLGASCPVLEKEKQLQKAKGVSGPELVVLQTVQTVEELGGQKVRWEGPAWAS